MQNIMRSNFIIVLAIAMLFVSAEINSSWAYSTEKHGEIDNFFEPYSTFVAEIRQKHSHHIFNLEEIKFFKKYSKKLRDKNCPLFIHKTSRPLLIYVQKSIPEGKVGFNDPIYYNFYPENGFFFKGQTQDGQNHCYFFGSELKQFLMDLENKLNKDK